jgi:hypothetical protein
VSVSYVGSHGYNLLVQNDLNPPIPTMVNGQPDFLNAPHKNPNLGSLAYNVPDGSSSYISLQAYVTRNVGRNLQFQGSYTYSKCIDYGSISYEAGNSGQQAQSDPYSLAVDRGLCDFDIRHNFTANASYLLPFHGNRFVEGWQFSSIATARSGSPFSVQDGFDRVGFNDPAGAPGERPDLAPGRSNNPIVGSVNKWFDPSAFVLQPAGFLGNLGRNTLIGPKFVDFDLALDKMIRITETVRVEFRAEAFNIFNHPNFGLPVATLFSVLTRTAMEFRTRQPGRFSAPWELRENYSLLSSFDSEKRMED